MIFVGLSISYANIRRWMLLTNEAVARDYELLAGGQRINPQHLWITSRPSDPALERLRLVSLLHLWVRPAWIDDWSQVAQGIANMLGLSRGVQLQRARREPIGASRRILPMPIRSRNAERCFRYVANRSAPKVSRLSPYSLSEVRSTRF